MSKTPSLWKTFLVFLAPLMLSNALQSLFGTVSNALLGQMIGVDALAAVSVCFPVMFFLFAFVMGLSTGATVLIGQAWGAGERDKVKAVAGATLAIGLLFSITVALFGGLFSRQLMTALATPPLDREGGGGVRPEPWQPTDRRSAAEWEASASEPTLHLKRAPRQARIVRGLRALCSLRRSG